MVALIKKDLDAIVNLIVSIWRLIIQPQVIVLLTVNGFILIFIYLISSYFEYNLSYWFIKDYLLVILPFIPLIINIEEQSIISLLNNKRRELFGIISYTLFINSEYTFNIWVELILVIVIFMIVFISTAAKYYVDNKIQFFDIVLSLIIIISVINSIILFIDNITDITTFAFWLSFTLEPFVWILNIPTLFILQIMMIFEKKVNTSIYGKHTYSYILVLFYFIKERIRLRFFLVYEQSIKENILNVKEFGMKGGGSRISVRINNNISEEDLVILFVNLIFANNQYTNSKDFREKYPNIIEVRNSKSALIAYWEWPKLKEKFKNKTYPRDNISELTAGVHITE